MEVQLKKGITGKCFFLLLSGKSGDQVILTLCKGQCKGMLISSCLFSFWYINDGTDFGVESYRNPDSFLV